MTFISDATLLADKVETLINLIPDGFSHLSRIFEHLGVLGDETHTDAGPVHLRRAARVREGGRASQRGALDFLDPGVPGHRDIFALGVQRQGW